MAAVKEKISGLAAEEGQAIQQSEDRDKQIVRTSVIGILANVFLAAFKAVIGMISGSIAITLDAVNNLSDAASSVITIAGTKLAGKPADKKHPFGYGRVEYLSAMIISVIVLYAGVTSLKESVTKIIHPEAADYTMIALVIVAAAVLVKIILGRYVEGVGHRVNSDSLVASGKDATLDSIISASTLIAAVIYIVTKVSLESWLGAIISIVIIKSGIDMLRETISEILGERADKDLARDIKKTVMSYPGVSGVYDLVLNNYGPDAYNGSLHIEVPDTYSASQIDELTRKISVEVYLKYQVILTAISVYSLNTKDPHIVEVRKQIQSIANKDPYVLQMHGFYLNEDEKTIRLDLVISFDAPNRKEAFQNVVAQIKEAYPGYQINAAMDTDFAES
ncbi:MAG: cation diffusion facilitator family transporter [Lachnospiraceae bacterium]|nr:cation diffusion facilitator family transporter [Lachnospiraceae bacterium]